MEPEFIELNLRIPRVDFHRLQEAARLITEIAPEWKETEKSLAARVLLRGLDNDELASDLIIDLERAKKVEARMKIAQRKQKAASLLSRKAPPATPPHA
jgi:hypothetical protein